jgi:hypothetical protein
MCRLRRAVLMRVVDDDLRSFVGHVALSFTLEKRMSLVRKIYIDSRTCSGNPADFTATLPEPIRADPTLGVILSQLTFVNNFETVMRDYTNRLYFGIDLGDRRRSSTGAAARRRRRRTAAAAPPPRPARPRPHRAPAPRRPARSSGALRGHRADPRSSAARGSGRPRRRRGRRAGPSSSATSGAGPP